MTGLPPWLKRTRQPGAQPVADPLALVRLAYRAVLRREADEEGLARYGHELRQGRSFAWLVEDLAASDEFRVEPLLPLPPIGPIQALTEARPMAVQAGCTPAELQRLWDHVAKTWAELGKTDAHWSVMTEDAYRRDSLGPGQLAAFYETGAREVSRLNAWLARAGITHDPDALCAELGCGVGRITGSLARQYRRVRAFDVSAPHLEAARARIAEEGRDNVEFVHVVGPSSLDALHDLDAFVSVIALQHSPPPIILDILGRVFAALRPGGYAFFQIPTYALDYRYSVRTHLLEIERGDRDGMEVHFVSQRDILALAHQAGLAVAEIQPDDRIGKPDRWISNTVLLVRP